MRVRLVGQSGIEITELAIGTATFGGSTSREEALEILDVAFEAGIRGIDTSDGYPQMPDRLGTAEKIVGEWLRTRGVREEVLVATKVNYPMRNGINGGGLGRVHLSEALAGSLERLGVASVDLYQAHQLDPRLPVSDIVHNFSDLVTRGAIAAYGLANWPAWQVARAVEIARARGWNPPTSVQIRYNLISRECESELIPACQAAGLGVLVFNALAGGLLVGKYAFEDRPEPGTRFGQAGVSSSGSKMADVYRSRYWSRANFEAVEEFGRICQISGAEQIGTALLWPLRNPAVSALILGASSVDQLRGQLSAMESVSSGGDIWESVDEIWLGLPRGGSKRTATKGSS